MTQHYKFDDWRNGSAWQTPQMTGHAVATAGAQTPPDAWAEYRTIADQLGTSPASVASAPEVYRRRLQEKQAAGQLQGAPQLKQWLDWNPADQASVSDDLENLARIEKESGLWNPAAGAVEGAARVQEYGGKSLARGALSAASGAVQATAHGELYQMEVLPQLRGLSEDEAFDLLYPPLPEEMQQVFPSGYAARREEERKEFQRTYAPLWQIANSEDGGAAYMARLKEGARSTLEIAGAIRAYREADWLAMSPGAQDFARRFDEVNDPDASTTDQMLSTLQLFVEDPTNGASFAAQIFGESLPAIGMAFGASAIAGPGAGVAALGAGVVSQEIDAVTAELYLEQGIDIRTKEGIDRILNDPALARDAQERGVLKGLIIASVDMATMGAGGLASRALTANPALDILFQTSANVIGGGGGEYVGSVAAGLDVSGGEILLEGVLELPGTVPDVVFGRTQFKDREAELRRQAQRGQLERAGAAAADSRTRQRLQGVVQRVVEEGLGGAEASVSVPVDAVDEYFQSIGQPVDPEMLGTTAEELASLRATGGDIQIPMGHYLDRIAGSEHLQFFLENTVLDSKDLTPQERMRFSEQMQDAVDTEVRAITRERDDATVEIFDRVYSQSLEGGRLTPIEAQANAEMVSRLVMTGAERTNLNPLEVFERMAPILRREGFAVPEDASRPTRRYVANERRARLSGELDSLRAMTEDTPVADVDQEQLQDLLDELGIDATGQDIAAAIELVEGLAKPQADPTAAVTSAGEVVPGPSASPAGGLSPTAQLLAQQLEQRGLDINELTNEEIIDALGMADDDVFFQPARSAPVQSAAETGWNALPDYDTTADQALGAEDRIPTRQPKQAGSPEDYTAEDLRIGQAAMEANPEAFAFNMNLMKRYPGLRHLRRLRNPQRIAEEVKAHIIQNLLYLHDSAPAILRERGHHWYDGARRITTAWADRYGVPDKAVAGALASLSPQKDWYQNVSLAERALDTVVLGDDLVWSPEMQAFAEARMESQEAVWEDLSGRRMGDLKLRYLQANDPDTKTAVAKQIAAFVRAYDEVNNDRAYAVLSPEGDLLPPSGKKVAWGSLVEISKAVTSILSPDLVSEAMGDRHKVRNFYNNIIAPNATAGDVTIDTHAVAAGFLLPLSGASTPVSHALATAPPKGKQPRGFRAAKSAGVSGAHGTFGLIADAYRDAAAQRNILPRQMQSITWEAVRLLFTDTQKRNTRFLADVDALWDNDDLTIEEKQNAVVERAGGIGEPSWGQPGARSDDPAGAATYSGDLSARGRDAAGGGDRGRAGIGDPDAVPEDGSGREPAGGPVVGGSASLGGDLLAGAVDRGRDPGGSGELQPAPAVQYGRDTGGVDGVLRTTPEEFAAAAERAFQDLGPVAAQVGTDPGDAQFLLDDGHTGFAMSGDNIISVFSNPKRAPKGAAGRVLAAAVAMGGRRLDGFNTSLPKLYARGGFRAVGRLPFDPQYAPRKEEGAGADWDAEAMEAEGRAHGHEGWGAPDVVFMVHDPENASHTTDVVLGAYEEGIAAQDAALAEIGARPTEDPDTFYQTAPARPQTRTLFHGGPRLTPTAQLRAPLFLTSDRSGAEWFASERGDSQENTVREVSVSIDNPFVIDGPKDVAALARLLNDAGVEVQFTDGPYGWEWFAPDVSKHSPYDGTNPMDVSYIPAAREALLDAGYDAIEGLDVLENSEIPATVVLDPESSIVNDPDTFYQTAQEPGPGTPEFDAWFEGSQVVDENGDPLIVYHGTMMGGFTIFRTSEFAPGIFASSDRELAATYSDNVSNEAIPEPGRGLRPDSQVGVYPVFMSLKNPLVIDVEGDDWTDVPVPGGEPGQTASSNGIAEWAKEQGYDGVIFKNMRDVGPAAEDAPVSDIYAAFDSTQVKSVRNTGAFDPANPDILYQPAYQGSGAIFDRHSTDFVGTGEGASTFGWGLYFSSVKAVAEWYRTHLAPLSIKGRSDLTPLQEQVLHDLGWSFRHSDFLRVEDAGQDWLDAMAEQYDEQGMAEEAAFVRSIPLEDLTLGGRIYEVSIPDDNDLLNYDAPLSDQPPKVADALRELGIEFDVQAATERAQTDVEDFIEDLARLPGARRSYGEELDGLLGKVQDYLEIDDLLALVRVELIEEFDTPHGRKIFGDLRERAAALLASLERIPADNTGKGAIDALTSRLQEEAYQEGVALGNRVREQGGEWSVEERAEYDAIRDRYDNADREASLTLLRAGIPGHKYLDGLSRDDGEGTYNFVIYDGSAVAITSFEQQGAPPQYPMAPRSEWWGDANFADTGGRLVWTTPQAYLDAVRPLELDEVARDNIDDLKGHITSGRTLDPLAIWKNGKEDGRHRAHAAMELGVQRVPVLVWADPPFAEIEQSNFSQSENDFARGKIEFQSEGGDRFAGGRPIITLFDQKDLSTLIHENGHWVFEFFDALSKEPTAEPSLVEDVATLREWLGAEPGAQLTRDQHEMMADGWLTWVYEGKAPIPELGRMFRRMAAWLTDIYTRARAAPDVQLNDEVRAVFERFLATEEAIAEAKAQPENRPLFTSPADIGMTEREWTPYARIAEDDDNAHRKLLTKVMDSVRKRRTKEYADERKRVRAEVADEVEQERKYRAWSILAKGTNPASVEGTPEGLLDMPDLQLDRDELVARFGGDDPDAMLSKVGKQRLGGRRNVYTAKAKSGTGIGLDEFAEAIGYQTAGEMVSELSTMRKLDDEIDARTDDIMEAEYPSGLDEGAIEEEAIALMHSSTKEQRLSTEARTLARRSGKSSKNLTHRVMRERAQRIIDGLEVRKIRSASFLRAERKAAREAQRAFSDVVRAGQEGTAKASEALRKAAEAKERQLLNHHLYMIARDAEKQVLRGRSDMQKYLTRQTVRQRIGQTHVELIEAVAAKYSFRQSSQKNIDQMQRLVDYVANAPDDVLASMNIDPRVLVEANRKHYSRMTLSEFNGVVDTARNLAKLGRDQGVLESATERVLLNEALTAVEGSLSHHDVNKDSIRNAAGGFVRDVYTPDTIATIIDRGDEYGAFYEAVIKRVHLAQAEEQRLTTKTAKHLQDTVFHHLKGKSAADLHTGRLVPGGPKQEWTKSQIMVLALNYGTENGQQRVLDERVVDPAARLTENEALALMDTLDDTEWAFVESVWETFDGLWPQIAEVHQRRTRVKPVKEAGVEIRLPSGRVVQGNYYPIIYDPKSEQAASISFMDPVEMNMKGAGYATTARVANGMTITRAATGGGRSVSYEMTPMIGALRANIRYITMSEAVDNTSRVLRNVRTRNAFIRAGKAEDLKYLDAWLKDVATGAVTSQAKWAMAMRFAKNNFTMSALGANLKTVAMQPLGIAHTIQTIGLPATIRGLLSWIGKSEVTREGVMNLSSVMAERENTWQVAMTDFYTDAAAQAPTDMSRAQAAHAIMGKASFYLISKTQFIVDMITWQGAYDAALAQGHTQEEAIHRADRSVIRAQGGGLFADRSGLQRGTTEWGGTQSEVVKALTPLAGYMFTKWNRGRVSAARMAGQGYSPAAILRFTADLGVLFVLEGAIMAALWAWEADEDEYEDELLVEFLTAEVLSSTLGGIPFVKEGVSLWRGYGVEAPVYNPASAAFRFTAQLATAFEDMEIDKPDRFWKSFVNAGGALTGWPSVQINRLLAPAWDDDVGPANMAFGRNPTEER